MLTRSALKNPYAVFALCMIALVLGAVSYKKMRVDIFPEIKIPTILVTTFYRGMSPGEMEGAITLRGDNMAGGEALQPGQQAVIRKRGVNQPPEITITPIPSEQKERLEDMVNGACQARKKVYFDVAERQNDVEGATSEFEPIVVNPVDPAEVGQVVSPARP